MKRPLIRHSIAVLWTLLCASVFVPGASGVTGSFVYKLSDFTGPVPYNWTKVFVDGAQNEIYVLYQNVIRIFNKNGMEVYRFGEDLNIGAIVDGVVDKDGDILLLAYEANNNVFIQRVNYRGEPVIRITISGLPPDFSGFMPSKIIYRQGELYLASVTSMKVVIADTEGRFKTGYDLADLMKLTEKERTDNTIVGFSVDKDGNMLCTIPTLFKAYVISRDGTVNSFGQPGGAPGRFNVVAGITSDYQGNYLVIDKLKCQVMIYDKNYKFIASFGSRGERPQDLIAPDDIAIDSENNIYVTQSKRRGVNVYRLNYE